jgi:hypothetical protein
VGYKIESNTPRGSGESRGEGAAHEWGSARVEKAKLRRERVRWIVQGVKDKRRVLEGVHHDERTAEGGEGKKREERRRDGDQDGDILTRAARRSGN